jgi:hypothetical protein
VKDWIVAYRVVFRERGTRRRARIVELRISASEFLPRPVNDPRATFSFDAVRRGVTERQFQAALAATVDALTSDPFLEQVAKTIKPVRQLRNSAEGRGAGRPGRPRSFYAKFAIRYHDVEHDERREPGTSTHAILATEYSKPPTTIAKWIRIARQQGFLTPAHRGQRGGMRTEAALALIRGRK